MIWIALTACAIFSFLLTGFIRRVALARNFMDVPNQRSSHTIETPNGGGLAIFLSYQLTFAFFVFNGYVPASTALIYIIAGSWIAVVSLFDDIRHIPARWRLLTHFLGAALALFWFGGLPPLPLVGEIRDLSWLGHVAALVFLVWFLNLYNFMDGIDGIASIESVTVCLGGVLLYWLTGAEADLWIPPLVLVAASIGFLYWNFPSARIFLGDSGSAFIGFVIGLFSLQAAWYAPELLWSWAILLGGFIVDATVTLIRRIRRGDKFYEAHRSHAYQYASRKHGSHVRISVTFGLINLLWLLPIAIFVAIGWMDGISALGIAYLPLVILAYVYNAGARELQEV